MPRETHRQLRHRQPVRAAGRTSFRDHAASSRSLRPKRRRHRHWAVVGTLRADAGDFPELLARRRKPGTVVAKFSSPTRIARAPPQRERVLAMRIARPALSTAAPSWATSRRRWSWDLKPSGGGQAGFRRVPRRHQELKFLMLAIIGGSGLSQLRVNSKPLTAGVPCARRSASRPAQLTFGQHGATARWCSWRSHGYASHHRAAQGQLSRQHLGAEGRSRR